MKKKIILILLIIGMIIGITILSGCSRLQETCTVCDGSGKCPWCGGTGWAIDLDLECNHCQGTGKCPNCGGTGKVL